MQYRAMLLMSALAAFATHASLCADTPKLSDKQRAYLKKAELFIAKGETGKAVVALRAIRRSFEKTKRHPVVDAHLGNLALAAKKIDLAHAYVGDWGLDQKKYEPTACRAYIASGHVHMAKNDLDTALRIFDWVATCENGKNATHQAHAVEGVGLVWIRKGDFGRALDAFGFGVKKLESEQAKLIAVSPGAKLDSYAADLLGRLRNHRKSTQHHLHRLAREAKEKAFKERVGKAFLLYRQAENLRRVSGKPAEARRIYRELAHQYPRTVYAEASKLYAAMCLIDLGTREHVHQAEKELTAFVDGAEPAGLYKGEALLQLGRVAIEFRLDQKAAERAFDRLARWIGDIRKARKDGRDEAAGYQGVKEEAIEFSRPPVGRFQKPDLWGKVREQRVGVGQLVNRQTCDWYLDDLEATCCLYRGFLDLARGQSKEALAMFKKVVDLNSKVRQEYEGGLFNTFGRLQIAARNGHLVATPREMKWYKGRLRFAVLLADFYYLSEQFDAAAKLFRRLLDGAYGRLTPAQKDYLHFGLANAIYRSDWKARGDGYRKAFDEMEKVLRTREGTYTEMRASVACLNLSHRVRDDQIKKRARQYAMALARSGVKDETVSIAQVNLAIGLRYQERYDEALALLRAVSERDKEVYVYAKFLINKIQKERDLDADQ